MARKGDPEPVLPDEPMVNRNLELTLLRRHLDEADLERHGHAVLLIGESGVGKSRLIAELAKDVRQHGCALITAHGLGRGAEPLLPIKDALRAYLGHTPARIRKTLIGAAPRLLDAIPFIGAFLGRIGDVVVGEHKLQGGLDGVYEELSRVLLGISEKRGLVLVIEDLHEADQDTLYFLNYFLRKTHGKRILVAMTVQAEQLTAAPNLPGLVTKWTSQGYATLTVVPLERAHVGEYVRSTIALGIEPDEELVDRVFSLTGGNPFYLRETVRILAEPGAIPARGEQALLQLPPNLERLIERRLDRADAQVKEFLSAAAVIADPTQDIGPIAYVMDIPVGKAIRALETACTLGILREGDNGEISFVHDIIRTAVYAKLGPTSRRYLHGRAAEWFDERGFAASSAGHYGEAGRIPDMVRTSLRAAADAEQEGLYHSALFFYQKARPHMSVEEIGPLLGRVLIVLGDWTGADEILALLPDSEVGTHLLRLQLRFVRNDLSGALESAHAALARSTGATKAFVLNRIADVALYAGDFPEALRWADQVETADGVTPHTLALNAALLGAVAYHCGDLDKADEHYARGLAILDAQPEPQRDVLAIQMLRGNVAAVALTRGDLEKATEIHSAALKKRREVADARGALHSLHGVAQCLMRSGDEAGAVELLDQAEQLADSLGEKGERTKVMQSRGMLALRHGDAATAYDLIAKARLQFGANLGRYDVSHATVALSMAAAACGKAREAIELAASAREVIDQRGYGLLRIWYPETVYPVPERIAGALTAYMCGDAVGLPFETNPPEPAPPGLTDELIERLDARDGWERGSTSDDTALTLLIIDYLIRTGGEGDGRGFLAEFAERADGIRGLGPSTTAAVEHFRRTGEVPADHRGSTNGAAMRALPVGWVTPISAPDRLIERTIELSRVTHRDPEALVSACVVAACASWAVEGAEAALLGEIAAETAQRAAGSTGAGGLVAQAVQEVVSGIWRVPDHGVSMDPAETTAGVLHCVTTATSLRDGLLRAVKLGGDTDTIAAMVGGILGAHHTAAEVLAQLPWSGEVNMPAADGVAAMATSLTALRRRQP